MNIVYSLDKRIGAQLQLCDFLNHTVDSVFIAGYSNLSEVIPNFNWTLDYIDKYHLKIDVLEKDILEKEPDVVIVDNEPIVASIAVKNNIPLVKCSALHLLDGIQWKPGQQKYKMTIEPLRHKLRNLPKATLNLIYAPFGFTNACLNDNYEWVEPYAVDFNSTTSNEIITIINSKKRINNLENKLNRKNVLKNEKLYNDIVGSCSHALCGGEVSVLADLLANFKSFSVVPDVLNPENVLAALMCSNYGIAKDFGQIEYLDQNAIDDILINIETEAGSKYEPVGTLLHQRIEELWESM